MYRNIIPLNQQLPFAGFPLLAAGTPRITTPSDTTQQQMIYEALNNMQMLNQRHQQQNHIQMESANQHAALLQAALHSNAHNKKDEQRWLLKIIFKKCCNKKTLKLIKV